jgi:hypothetical protein
MAALPQIQALAALAGIDAPPQPANPPTLTDIVKAHDYNEQATAQRRAAQTYGKWPESILSRTEALIGGQGPTDNEAGTGLVYEQAVIAANAGIGALLSAIFLLRSDEVCSGRATLVPAMGAKHLQASNR